MKAKIIIILTSLLFVIAALAPGKNVKIEPYDCLSCHGQSFSSMPSHFIEGDDDCRFCHDVPNAVGKAGVIRDHPVDTYISNTLCQSCHLEIDNSNSMTKHDGFNCINCHDAHGSALKHALVQEPVALCGENCHTSYQLGNSHPVGNELVDANNEDQLTCISSCHSNHQPREEKMLQVATIDLCTSCHEDY